MSQSENHETQKMIERTKIADLTDVGASLNAEEMRQVTGGGFFARFFMKTNIDHGTATYANEQCSYDA